MNSIALIPMRLGSKGIPQKNIQLLNDQPLFFWVIDAVIKSSCFSKIVVSTEAPKIADEVLKKFKSSVEIDFRPPELAADTTPTDDVLVHYALRNPCDWLGLFQVTSPLLKPEHVQMAVSHFQTNNYDSLLSVCEFKRFLWSQEGVPLNYLPAQRPRRQDFSGCLIENGAFYFMKYTGLLQHRCRLFDKIGTHILPEELIHELDSPQDFRVLQALLKS